MTASVSTGASLWLVYAFPGHTRSHYPQVLDVLERDFQRVRSFSGTLGDGAVRVFRYPR